MVKMTIYQIGFYFLTLLVLVKPLGWYMAQVYQGKPCGLNRIFRRPERFLYRLCGIHPDQEMDWKRYLTAMLLFNLVGLIVVYLLQRLQFYLPLNPQAFTAVSPDLAFNTAASFVTNTNWQAYSGETTMSYLSQMLAFTVQNFVSAATGMSLLMALIRGISRHESTNLGNFWVDIMRGTFYILVPLSLLLALILVSQGVIQNFKPYQEIELLQQPLAHQTLPMGLCGFASGYQPNRHEWRRLFQC